MTKTKDSFASAARQAFLALSLAMGLTVSASGEMEKPSPVQDAAVPLLAEVKMRLVSATKSREFAKIERVVRGVELLPQNSDRWTAVGDALVSYVRATQSIEHFALIERVYTFASELDSTNPEAWCGRAWAAAACHRFDDTVLWANLALTKDPTHAPAHGLLGDAAVELGRFDMAERHYQKMLDLQPDLSAYSRAAHLAFMRGNREDALLLMQKALDATAASPSEATAWCVKAYASILLSYGNVEEALAIVSDARKRDAASKVLIVSEAMVRIARGELSMAEQLLEIVVHSYPDHSVAAALHDLAIARGDAAAAETYAARLIRLHQSLAELGIQGGEGQLAHFYADRGEKLDEAVRLAVKEHSHHKTVAAADTLAWVYFRSGRIADAAKLLPEMLRGEKVEAAVLYHAGLIAADSGDRVSAINHLRTALQTSPNFNPVHAPIARKRLLELESRGTPIRATASLQ